MNYWNIFRPTEVHRFLIKGTIEEKMFNMLKTFEVSASSHDTEENVLTIGDITNLLRDSSQIDREESQDSDIDGENETSPGATAVEGRATAKSSSEMAPSTSGTDAHLADEAIPSTSGIQLVQVKRPIPSTSSACAHLGSEPIPSTSGTQANMAYDEDEETCGMETCITEEQTPSTSNIQVTLSEEPSGVQDRLGSTSAQQDDSEYSGLSSAIQAPADVLEEEVVTENFSVLNGIFKLQ